ncbi:MAG: ATP-binding protein [Candidatus Hydrogenedentota bacterium]
MIQSVKFCVNHVSRIRKLEADDARLRFEPGYNVLIGPNGSGKSTVLKALASCSFCEISKTSDDETKYITTETLNPLVGEGFSTREEMIQGVRSMFLSHGKGVLDSLRRQSHRSETVMLLDSPETGQDLENCEYIHQGLLTMAEQYQVIVATNNLLFVRGGNVIDLGDDYLARLIEATGKLAAEFGFSP